MGTEMNPYIVDMPTSFSFFGKAKKKGPKTNDDHERAIKLSQEELEKAATKSISIINDSMKEANLVWGKSKKALAAATVKHDISEAYHQELVDKNQTHQSLLSHVKTTETGNAETDN
jgi:6-phosphogluconolactonase/glucosamine-6-phosphate isomerase/deaminase